MSLLCSASAIKRQTMFNVKRCAHRTKRKHVCSLPYYYHFVSHKDLLNDISAFAAFFAHKVIKFYDNVNTITTTIQQQTWGRTQYKISTTKERFVCLGAHDNFVLYYMQSIYLIMACKQPQMLIQNDMAWSIL